MRRFANVGSDVLAAPASVFDSAAAHSFRRDARVIGVVGAAHGISHFFQLALPPLFPLLRADFDVSYAALGVLVGVFYAVSGVTQFAAGFVVDRVGARPVLFGGLVLVGAGAMLAALVPGIGWLYPVAALMGLGNGVFHPANFAILNATVATSRLGHAYSMHGVGGNLGYAVAPVVSFALGAALGWRSALFVMGFLGFLALALMATQRALLVSQRAADAHAHTLKASFALLAQVPIVLCFAYFVIQTTATVGLQTFTPAALAGGFDVPLALATSALTAYLLGSTAGIFTGGFLAARTARHDRVAMAGLLTAATLLFGVAAGGLPLPIVLPLFAVAGFALGITGPSRDLIVRSATPTGASGRVYGFVYSGIDLGATLGPVWFGYLLDRGKAGEMYFAIAVLLVVAMGAVVQVRRTVGVRIA